MTMAQDLDSTSAEFPTLFSPLELGPITLKNRIFSSGHDTVMVHDGLVTDQLVAYHRARAEGGAGLIVTQVAGIHETARYTSHVLMVTDDDCIPGYTRLAETVHEFGCKIISQIFHPGREIMESSDGALPVALAPSSVPNERFHVMPKAMTQDEIDDITRGYADGALRLRRAGFDGVEIVASHGYLPAQFLNPQLNLRGDAYGGTLDNRMRFLRNIIQTVRDAVGRDFVVGIRISATDKSFDGVDESEVIEICRRLDAEKLLDYFNITEGTSSTLAGSTHIAPPMAFAAAYTAPSARTIRDVVTAPVLVAGRINQPQEAEAVLATGAADACAMTRALICDPELPVKSQNHQAEDVRACIACNQACIGHFHLGYPISCIQRPETGRELEFGTLKPADTSRYVMVIGGGPAGMKAASVAAQRGHRVVLFEASGRVGGQVLLAEQLPHRAEFGGAATNLERELQRYGVTVKTRVEVDVEMVRSENPDVVIVATGATPYRPSSLELDDAMPVATTWDVINSSASGLPKGHIVVADWRCDWSGLGVAEMIARSGGRKVTLCVNGYTAGEMLQQYTRNAMLASAMRAKVTIMPNTRLFGADDDTVYLQNTLTSDPVLIEDVSGLVINLGHIQQNSLLNSLRDSTPFEVHGIGDCVSPRTVEEATLDALKVSAVI